MNMNFNQSTEGSMKYEDDQMFTELSTEEATAINGGGRIWRKIKRFFQRIWYGDPPPYEPGTDPNAPGSPWKEFPIVRW